MEGRTLQDIANLCKVPKSSVRKLLNILRPPQQKGRTPWNKGKEAGQIPWNKGMSESGTYPFPSPFKGHVSSTKGVPRNQETKDKICAAIRELNPNGYGFYEAYSDKIDTLYLIHVTYENQKFIKIGRTFHSVKKRFPLASTEIIKLWQAKHAVIFELEQLFLITFKKYQLFAPEGFLGRTECFTPNSPMEEMIKWVDSYFIDMTISSQVIDTSMEGSETTGEVESS